MKEKAKHANWVFKNTLHMRKKCLESIFGSKLNPRMLFSGALSLGPETVFTRKKS